MVRNHVKIANKSALFASSVGAIFPGRRACLALQSHGQPCRLSWLSVWPVLPVGAWQQSPLHPAWLSVVGSIHPPSRVLVKMERTGLQPLLLSKASALEEPLPDATCTG